MTVPSAPRYGLNVYRRAKIAVDPVAGIGLLASESKARILPVALKGMDEMKQGKRRWFRSGSLQVRIGEAIEPDPRLAPERLAESLHDAVSTLLKG